MPQTISQLISEMQALRAGLVDGTARNAAGAPAGGDVKAAVTALDDAIATLSGAAEPVGADPDLPDIPPYTIVSEAPGAPDDLRHIRGISSATAYALTSFGITRYAHIAGLTARDVAQLKSDLGYRCTLHRDNWIEQAAILAKGHSTSFSRRGGPLNAAYTDTAPPAEVQPDTDQDDTNTITEEGTSDAVVSAEVANTAVEAEHQTLTAPIGVLAEAVAAGAAPSGGSDQDDAPELATASPELHSKRDDNVVVDVAGDAPVLNEIADVSPASDAMELNVADETQDVAMTDAAGELIGDHAAADASDPAEDVNLTELAHETDDGFSARTQSNDDDVAAEIVHAGEGDHKSLNGNSGVGIGALLAGATASEDGKLKEPEQATEEKFVEHIAEPDDAKVDERSKEDVFATLPAPVAILSGATFERVLAPDVVTTPVVPDAVPTSPIETTPDDVFAATTPALPPEVESAAPVFAADSAASHSEDLVGDDLIESSLQETEELASGQSTIYPSEQAFQPDPTSQPAPTPSGLGALLATGAPSRNIERDRPQQAEIAAPIAGLEPDEDREVLPNTEDAPFAPIIQTHQPTAQIEVSGDENSESETLRSALEEQFAPVGNSAPPSVSERLSPNPATIDPLPEPFSPHKTAVDEAEIVIVRDGEAEPAELDIPALDDGSSNAGLVGRLSRMFSRKG